MTLYSDEVRASLHRDLRPKFDSLVAEWDDCTQGGTVPYETLAALVNRGWKKPRGDSKPICEDWREWTAEPDLHPPFHYWRWNDAERHRSEQRLGQRIYISACLLWTAMHDRLVGKRLADKYPNWSAISAYYSMVHALRLVWFVLYGGFPTSHVPLGEAMAGQRSTAADWKPSGFGQGRARLSTVALTGAIRDGLGNADLANRVAMVGRVFCGAATLRNDSNYESLILAHQYRHGTPGNEPDGFVSVEREFRRVYEVMRRAQDVVLEFTSSVVKAAFVDERAWFCPREAYNGGQLLKLLRWHVHWKIVFASEGWDEAQRDHAEWWTALPGIEPLRQDERPLASPAPALVDAMGFGVFDLKSGIMRKFHDKIKTLEDALRGQPANGDTGRRDR